MPSKAITVDRAVAKLPSIPKELFLSGPMTGEAINEAGIAFKKTLIESSLNAEPGLTWARLLKVPSAKPVE